MADLKATQSSNKDDWETPWWLVKALERRLSIPYFDLDPAASSENKKARAFYDGIEGLDGLKMPWNGYVFCNPPYSGIAQWVKKGYEEAKSGRANVTMLIAARTDTRWWWDYVRWGRVSFIKGRIKFVGATSGAPFPSAIVHFGNWLGDVQGVSYYWDARQEEHQ